MIVHRYVAVLVKPCKGKEDQRQRVRGLLLTKYRYLYFVFDDTPFAFRILSGFAELQPNFQALSGSMTCRCFPRFHVVYCR